MAPDILTIPVMPESRLKAVIQANALLHALLSAACIVTRHEIRDTIGLQISIVIPTIGFIFAFYAAFLFRISIKEPLSRRFTIFAAIVNLLSTCLIALVLVFHVFVKPSSLGTHLLASVAIIQATLAVVILLLSRSSSHSFSQADVVAL